MKLKHLTLTGAGIVTMLLLPVGCAKVALEGGDKPIHIVHDVNIRVDKSLEDFFAYQKNAPTTTPADVTATQPVARQTQ
jgi:hypothetical protein